MHRVRVDVARQPDVPLDGLAIEQLQVAAGKALEEPGNLFRRQIAVTRREQLRELGLAPIDQLVAVSERQLVVGVDVQPPEQLFLPRRERLEADRFDVGQRQEAEHLQSLFDADQRGEPPDRLGIFGVAAKRDHRHLQVVGDEKLDHLARLGRQRQALEDAPGQADALRDVVLVARFPDIVQQQREHQQLRAFEVLQQRREPLAVARLRARRRRRRGATWRGVRCVRIARSVCSSTVYLW